MSGKSFLQAVKQNGRIVGYETVIEDHGVKLYVDRKSYIFLAGTTLEFSGGLNGKGFFFNNPNAKTTCGCGTSFSV